MTEQELREYAQAEFVGPTIQITAPRRRFVAVYPDGLDHRIECGLCGDTVRGFANGLVARKAADRHEAECPERNNVEWEG